MKMMTMTNTGKDDDDEEDDDMNIGFLFESYQPTIIKRFQWNIKKNKSKKKKRQQTVTTTCTTEESATTTTTTAAAISTATTAPDDNDNDSEIIVIAHVALHVVDDIPGSVQSGHYLWNGAPTLCDLFIYNQRHYQQQRHMPPPTSILELGCGCGLVSLTLLQIYSTTLERVVLTDHDPTVLQRARDNYELTTKQDWRSSYLKNGISSNSSSSSCSSSDNNNNNNNSSNNEQFQLSLAERLDEIDVSFELLEWGSSNKKNSQMKNDNIKNTKFDWIVGSDLIYCKEVVVPLFETVVQYLKMKRRPTNDDDDSDNFLDDNDGDSSTSNHSSGSGGRFYLSQSFVYDDETEEEINKVMEVYHVERIIHVDTLLSSSSSTTATPNTTEHQRIIELGEDVTTALEYDYDDGVRIQEFRFQ